MWFKELTGFDESSSSNVRDNIVINGDVMTSLINSKTYQFGTLETPTLGELMNDINSLNSYDSEISLSEIVGDIKRLHCNHDNVNALFQAASQFNLLEMMGPHISPERGVDIYEQDLTQGPACAIACGAGTIYRNYFVPLNGQIGQSLSNQIDCLELIGNELGNNDSLHWEMKNGYALLNQAGILNINLRLNKLTTTEREELKNKLKVGIQWNTEVTFENNKQIVSQIYCSALPVAYSHIESFYWEPFAKLILEATYEATLYSALINLNNTKCNKVFLTLVGGGAFGNKIDWIIDSLHKTINKFKFTPLDVKIVSYGTSNNRIQKLIADLNSK